MYSRNPHVTPTRSTTIPIHDVSRTRSVTNSGDLITHREPGATTGTSPRVATCVQGVSPSMRHQSVSFIPVHCCRINPPMSDGTQASTRRDQDRRCVPPDHDMRGRAISVLYGLGTRGPIFLPAAYLCSHTRFAIHNWIGLVLARDTANGPPRRYGYGQNSVRDRRL